MTVCTELPDNSSAELNRLYILNITNTEKIDHFESWVAFINSTGGKEWKALDAINISESKSIISPVDWAIDEYYGGDGGTILWRGDYGLIYNCTFLDSNSARRGGAAYMTGGDYVTYDLCNFTNCTSGTNGGGVDWLAGANYGQISNCIFNNTRAARSAGAIYYDGDYGIMENITIINATSYGGFLPASKDGRVKYAGWDSSHWDTNTTGGDAGAIMITGDHLYMYNATFINCTAVGRGGAIFLQDNKNATFELCVFENNYAKGIANNTWANYTQERNESNNDTKVNYKLTGHGGAIAFDVNAKDCQIIDSKFYNNSARRNGGAINFDQGSINNNITHCEFINNTVYDDGGAINFDHGADFCGVYNTTFYNNNATGRFGSTSKGGTICLVGNNVTIENSTFTLGKVFANITEKAKENETWGGAMFITGNGTIVKNCTFDNCYSQEDGGALYVIGDECKLYNSTFTNNLVGDDGGAIYWTGELGYIYNITCKLNHAIGSGTSTSKGGAVALIGNLTVLTKSKFEMNSAIVDGGSIYATGNFVNITECSFEKSNVTSGNKGTNRFGGGAIYVLGNYSTIINCSFDRSNAKKGGIIYIQGNNVTINNVTSIHTFATEGGAIYVEGANATIYKSNITMTNSTTSSGGAIYILGANANISESYFAQCIGGKDSTSAVRYVDGGAIYVNGTDATIEKSVFTKTNVSQAGGAIYVHGNNTHINDCNFTQSHARIGGIIYIDGPNAVISGSSLKMSSADTSGGAIYVNGTNATVEKSAFGMNNATNNGGAIYVEGNLANIKDSNFTIDIALTGNGGAIYVGGVNTTISGIKSNTTITPNGQGGAIYVDGVNTIINGSSISRSQAINEGGAIYLNGDYSKIINSTIMQTSSSSSNGGAVYIKAVNAIVKDSKFGMNNATYKGGSIYIEGAHASIINSTFNKTFARISATTYTKDNQGGAIYIAGNYANITESVFDSAVSAEGGAIYSKGSYSDISYSNFTNNLAQHNGGAIFWSGTNNDGSGANDNDILGCIFINNTAKAGGTSGTRGGGAIYYSENGAYSDIRDSKFINNTVQATDKADGGAVLWDKSSHGIIDYCTFDGNYITSTNLVGTTNRWIQGGALFLRAKDNYTISNCVFENCWSAKEAGAVYLSVRDGKHLAEYNIILVNTTFINNTAKAGKYTNNNGGGALQVKECDYILIKNVTFINNTANQGGAVTLISPAGNHIYFNDCNFTGNNASFKDEGNVGGIGGSIWAQKNLILNNCTISDSYASQDGGGLYAASNIVSYSNLTFINNLAGDKGGALYWFNAGATIEKMVFINNSANQGGAIYIPSKTVTVQNNNFTGNTAVEGGAIYVGQDEATIKNNNFTNNSAQRGGAIFEPDNYNYEISISSSSFDKNHADYGGAIYSGFKKERSITSCNFTNNYAIDGGAIYINSSNQQIESCIFDGNNATGNGGSVYVHHKDISNINIINTTFKNSHAANGGAVYNGGWKSANLIINNNTFIKNTAIYNGGAVLYVINEHKYRDYNKFDTYGYIDPVSKRTDLCATAAEASTHFIVTSLFLDNTDYELLIRNVSDRQAPVITVILSKPGDVDTDSLKWVVNITNETFFKQIVVDPSNIVSHYNDVYDFVYVDIDEGLKIGETYNVTVGFYDGNYMYKETSLKNLTAYGDTIGDFQILQYAIMGNITQQKDKTDVYVINLTKSYRFTRDDFNKRYDWSCMNLTTDFIDKPLIIYGNGWTLDARGFSRIFNITASNITFVNVQFVNGNASGKYSDDIDKGGALFWAGGNGTLDNCLFENNTASYGGGIYYNSTASDCIIINTTFEKNSAIYNGGAIDCNASNMGLYNTTFITNYADTGAALCREINATGGHGFNNTFRSNVALTNGSALAWINANKIHIDTYYFYDNIAGNSGGAIYVGNGSANCEIVNCIFDNNKVVNDTGGHGGAIEWYSEDGLVLNSTFTRNSAYHGGAVYVGFSSKKINVTNSTFRENIAVAEGGAIGIEASAVYISESKFYYNNATTGGAVYVGGQGTTNNINASVFIGNKAKDGMGGAINWVASSGNITYSNFTSNCADYGGGIYLGGKSDNSSISHCIFTNNSAKYYGGAIDSNATRMNLTHTIFDSNTAQFGAALCREVNAKGGFGENVTFINNHAYVAGAALGWMGSVNITIRNYTFINNSADVGGGAIYVGADSHNCSIIDCNFENNYVTNVTDDWNDEFSWTAWDGTPMYYGVSVAPSPDLIGQIDMEGDSTVYYYADGYYPSDLLGLGGAVTCIGSNATIINSNFTNNTAKLGGAFYAGAASGNTIINGTIFKDNIAKEDGGAIYLRASAVHIDDSKFYNNLAINGSAVYVGGVGTANKIHTSTFEGNNATDCGGAIYWRAYEGEIFESNFTNNRATYGGAIYLNGVSNNTIIVNSTFKYNNATKNGGAIECNASNIGIYNLTFERNYAEYGAALCREIGATKGHGYNNTFIANHAGISGAALAWIDVSDINITYYKFINNTAEKSGGAIYVSEGSPNCKINNCTFEGNYLTNMTEKHFGGAIDCAGDNLTIKTSSFKDNRAYSGGALYVGSNSGNVTVLYSNFTENSAVSNGGALALTASGVNITHVLFKSNEAGESGGALYVGGTGTRNVVWYTVFENNTAKDHGGAINWLANSGEVFYSNFTNNSAVYGGGIYLNHISSSSKIVNVIFTGNRATKNGGAIDCNASYMGLNNTQFISNYAGEYGAALCREADAEHGYGGNNTFISNYAGIAGAALAWLDVDEIAIHNYIFYNNSAKYSGGAIYVSKNSPNCKVFNSTFELNYVEDVLSGRGGVIDWLGANGTIYNSTFSLSYAIVAGALYIASDNMNITKSNFTYAITLQRGGSILGDSANNATIADCYFDNSAAIGYITPEDKDFGQGGAIYWVNSENLTISNTVFYKTESHADGAVYLLNCNNSGFYNVLFNDSLSIRSGGSISWINSTNGTVDNCTFIKSEALYNGGAINLVGIDNITVKNSKFNDTLATKANGGSIYVDGNLTLDNNSFTDYGAYLDWGASLYFHNGTSTVVNSTFYGEDAIWVYRYANVTFTGNNVSGLYPNKDVHYLETKYDSKYNPVDYSLWNDGTVYLDGNNFGYVIFNNGTIESQTYTYILDNKTVNATWNENFTFWATIKDDNNNTIISVKSLNTTNDKYPYPQTPYYDLPYNAKSLNVTFQGIFHITGFDTGLKKNKVYNGTLNVLAPTRLDIGITQVNEGEKVTITARISKNDIPFTENVTFLIDGKPYSRKVINDALGGIATLELFNLSEKTYSVTAKYPGDINHFPCENSTFFVVNLRETWIRIIVNNVVYGGYPVVNITTNGNGTIMLSLNGESRKYNMTNKTLLVNGSLIIPFDTLYNPGTHYMNVVYIEDGYYKFATNDTSFEVFYQNNTFTATPQDITFGGNEIIDVTLNENATGYVAITIGDDIYIAAIDHGTAQFNISGLAAKTYENITVRYNGDVHVVGNSTNVTFTVSSTDKYKFNVKVDDIEYKQDAVVRVSLETSATGSVTIYINGTDKGTVDLTNGEATLNVPGLGGGHYLVNVVYTGDSTYTGKNNDSVSFNVNSAKWEPSVREYDYKPYGEYSTINITNIPKDIAGVNLTVEIDGIYYYNVTINKTTGKATLRFNDVPAGTHTAHITYPGDANYSILNKVFGPSIPKATPTIILTQDADGNVVATVSGTATGNVTFYMPGGEHTKPLDATGKAILPKSELAIGVNNGIIAIYNGDDNYNSVRNKTMVPVDKLPSTVNVTVAPTVVYGNQVDITVKIGEGQTGNVTITLNGVTYYATVNNQGTALFTVKGLNANNDYRIDVMYFGDATHAVEYNHTNFAVTPATLNVDVIANNVTVVDNPSFIVDMITKDFNGKVSITIPTDVVIYDGDVTTIITTNKLAPGEYTATVRFYNDANYNVKVIENVKFTVSRLDPTITVNIPDVTYPAQATATVTVTNKANGTIKVYLGTKLIGTGSMTNGQASVTLDQLGGGTHEVTVKFVASDEDKTNNNVETKYKFNVIKQATELTVGRSGSDVTVTIAPNVAGQLIKFNINGHEYTNTTDSNGVATIKNVLVIGNNYVFATYDETENYTYSYRFATFDVDEITTSLTVEADHTSYIVGQQTTITVTMTGVNAGKVLIEVNNYNYTVDINQNGIATLTVALPVGDYAPKAYYLGDKQHKPSNNAGAVFHVTDKVTPEITITVPTNVKVGDTVTIPVSSDGYGLRVWINNVEQVIDNGNVVYTVGNAGIYTIFAKTTENDQYYAANRTESFEVVKHEMPLTITVVDKENIKVGDTVVINVNLPGAGAGEKVAIKINGQTYDNITNSQGIAIFNVPSVTYGDKTVTALYNGSTTYMGNATTATFNVDKRDSFVHITPGDADVGGAVTIHVEVPAGATGYVYLDINGTWYVSLISVGINYPDVVIRGLGNGTYYVHATYSGDDKFKQSTNNSETFTVSKVNTDMSITVTDIDYGKNANITVSVEADATGYITISINKTENMTLPIVNGKVNWIVSGLAGGKYIVYANYSGDGKYNINKTDNVNRTFNVNRITPIFSAIEATIKSGETAYITFTVPENLTGDVTVTINNVPYVYKPTNGRISFTTQVIPTAGDYPISVSYGGDENYTSYSVPYFGNVHVDHVTDYEMNITAVDIKYGDLTNVVVNVPKDAVGEVILEIDGQNYTADISQGKATFNEDIVLTAGRYNITAYFGNDKYLNSTATGVFNVVKHERPMTITVANKNNIKVGDTATITVTLTGVGAGETVTIEINGAEQEATTNANGVATFTVSSVTYGPKTVVASYGGNNKYVYNSTTAQFTVNKYDPAKFDVVATGAKVGNNATISVDLGTGVTGYVTVNINGTNYTIKLANDGKGSVEIAGLGNGTYYVRATYMGNDKYNTKENNAETFEMTKDNAGMTISIKDITALKYGDKVNITVTLDKADATGFINLRIGTRSVSLPVGKGKVSWIVDDLSAGTHTVYADYSGDGKYNLIKDDAVYNKPFTVAQIAPDIRIVSIESVAGEAATIVVAIDSRATGNVNIHVDDDYVRPIGDGVIVITTNVLDYGDYSVTASYVGDTNFTQQGATLDFTTDKTSNYNLNISASDIKVGDNIDVVVNVPKDAIGKVLLEVEGQNYTGIISQGKATFTNALALAAGRYNITAYFGTDKYVNKTATASFNVVKYDTEITIADISPIKVGDEATITVTAPSEVINGIVIEIDGVKYTNPVTTSGKAVFKVQILSNGTRTVVASYAGNNKYLDNSTTAKFDVDKRTANFVVTATGNSVGSNATISVELPTNATGYVTVNVNGTNYTINLTQGKGSLQIAGLGNGTYNVVATYLGDSQYDVAVDNTKTFEMTKLTSSVSVSFDSPIIAGDDVLVTVTMSPGIDATVKLIVGDKNYDVAVVGGVGHYSVTNLANATYDVKAVFDGDDKYEGSTSEVKKLEVNKIITKLSIDIDKTSINVGDSAFVTIELLNASDKVLSINAIVTVKVNGANHTVGLVNGKGNFTLSGLASGTYAIKAVFAGDDRYTQSTSNEVTLTVNKIGTEIKVTVKEPVTYGNDAIITVELDANINATVNLIIDNDKEYNVGLVKGKGGFNASGLSSGAHNVKVVFAGDNKYDGDDDTKDFTIGIATLSADVTGLNVTVIDNAQFVINVTDDFKGNVSITIGDAVLYNGTVESLINTTVKLPAGEKTANVTFYGDSNYDKLTLDDVKFTVSKVTPVIESSIDDTTYPRDVIAVITVGNNANGIVNITVGKKTFTGIVSNGVANVPMAGLSAGYKNATIKFFSSDDYNTDATSSNKFIIYPNNSLLEILGASDTYKVGDDVTFKVKTYNSTGDFVIYINGDHYKSYGYESGRIYDINLGPKAEGTYVIGIILDGDENYTGYLASGLPTTKTINVVKNNLNISVNDTTVPSTIVVGSPVNITADLNVTVTGDVIFTINGANYTVHVDNKNVAVYQYTPVTKDMITVVATFISNDKYNSNASEQKQFEVNGVSTDINVTVGTPITYGNDAVITVEMNVTINATVKLDIDGTQYDVAIVNGKGGFNASGLTRGHHDIIVTFAGDDIYGRSVNDTGFDIGPATLTADVTALNVTVQQNTSFAINVTDDFKGNVSIKVGDTVLYNGSVKTLVSADVLPAGDYVADLVFYGDDNYNVLPLSGIKFSVSVVTPTIDVVISDVTYDAKAVAVITVGNNANGTVVVTVDGKPFDGTVNKGVATVDLTGLSAGSKVATVEFTSTDKYNKDATASAKFTVNKANSTVVIDVEKVYVYNDTIIINLTATGSAGAINVTINGKVYPVNAEKQVVIETIAAGDYTIIVKLADSENYTAAVNSTTFKVKQAETSITIGVESVYKVGDDIVISLTPVNSTDLTVTINGETYPVDGNNKVTITGGLKAGDYIVSAVLGGNENYTGSNDTKSFKVIKLQSELTVNVTNITVGESETIKVNVTDGAAGQVIITVNGTSYYTAIDGKYATLKLDNLTDGTYTVQVKYVGDEKYNESTGQAIFKVNKVTSSIKVEVDNITLGDVAVIRITVPANATGNVTIEIGSEYKQTVGVVDGEFNVTVPGLTVGNKTVKVTYNGDGRFLPITESANFTVGKSAVEMNVVAQNVTYGENVPITVFIDAEGNVTIKYDGGEDTKDIENGKVEFELDLNAGNYTINVTYNGNDKLNATSAAVNVTVAKADPNITVEVKDIVYGDVEHIIITSNAPGNVTVKINGVVEVVELT